MKGGKDETMKMIKFVPEQLMKYWSHVRECIVLALPPYTTIDTDNIIRIQERLLSGSLECWACMNDEKEILFGVVTTQIVVDEITETKNLLLFSVTMTEEHENSAWQEGYEYLSAYAKSKGCSAIIAYTNQESVIMLAKNLGADVGWHFLKFPLI